MHGMSLHILRGTLLKINSVHLKSKRFKCNHCDHSTYKKGTFQNRIISIHRKEKSYNVQNVINANDLNAATAIILLTKKEPFGTILVQFIETSKTFECSECDYLTSINDNLNPICQ